MALGPFGEDDTEPAVPLVDVPRAAGGVRGPAFSTEADGLLRTVHEHERAPGGRRRLHHRGRFDRVVRFREKSLLRTGFLRTAVGTVFASRFVYLQLVWCWTVTLVFAVLSFYFSKYTDPEYELFLWYAESGAVFELTRLLSDIDKYEVVASVAGWSQTLVAFILALFLEKSVNIWWTMRHDVMQSVLNTVANLSMRMAIYFPEDRAKSELVLRYGLCSLALLWKDAREVDAWTRQERDEASVDDLSEVVDAGLLTPDEAELLAGCPAKCQVPWVWIASYFVKLCMDGSLPDPLGNQEAVLRECFQARNNLATMLARVNTQFPLNYTHLVVTLCKLLMLLQSGVAGYIIGFSVYIGRWEWVTAQAVFCTLTPIYFQAIVQIKEAISNPFRDDVNDFSWPMFHTRVANECAAFFDAGAQPPHAAPGAAPATLPPQFIVRQVTLQQMRGMSSVSSSPLARRAG